MDLNKIGLMVGILALMLAIPLAVVANLLTPRVREWYSTTSSKRLKKRIAQLEEKLRQSGQEWTFSQAEWETFDQGFIAATATFISLALLCTFLGLAIASTIQTLRHVMSRIDSLFLLILVFVGYLLNMMYLARLTIKRSRAWELHTPMGRDGLLHEIEGLKSIAAQQGIL
jgi:hypothetical protein